MADFTDTYTCPDCRREGAPISDQASADEYRRGWHVTCPECGFSVSGKDKATVMRAIAVLDGKKRCDDITEEWLAAVGFKYREPGERQPFRHWTLQFQEPDDYGLYLETTMPGWLNDKGEHINADGGWFLWIGRDHAFLHTRHVYKQSEIINLVEALSGQTWTPDKRGLVPVVDRRPPAPDQENT